MQVVVLFLMMVGTIYAQGNGYLKQGSIGKPTVADTGKTLEFPSLTLEEWVGNKVIFKPMQKVFWSFGYQMFKGGTGQLGEPTYDECVGRIGTISKVTCGDINCKAWVRMDDTGNEYIGEVYSGTLRGVLFTRDIDSARAKWIGDTVWYNRSELLTYDEVKDETDAIKIPKYGKVTIKEVVVGWYEFAPVRLIVETMDNRQGYVDICVSKTNQSSILESFLSFSSFFLYSDPRIGSKWSKEVWTAIENEEVFIGMTVEQLRMSWGAPKEVNRTVTSNTKAEQWIYRDGNYVYVEDGLVTAIQN